MSINERAHAIVIGGSMAGLLAARVLSDHFDRITIIERDHLSETGGHRRGVPHGRHAHALLAGGLNVVEELFPGFKEEMVRDGALLGDPANDGYWFMEGGFLKKAPSGDDSILLSRPFLEAGVRERIQQISNVEFIDNVSVRGLQMNGKVTGVHTDNGMLASDLVVDASGRGSQVPKWLELGGYGRPEEERIEVKLSYTTRVFRRRKDHLNGDMFVVVPQTSEGKRGGVALAMEGDRWIVTLYGYFGQTAPEDLDGYIGFAKGLPSPALYDLVRDAEPIGEPCTFKFPASSRRRYEKMKRFPDGLLVFGDAICSFNPIYGQGMSASAQQAAALGRILASGSGDLSKRFFRDAAKVIDAPWGIAVGGDLKIPEVEAPRTRMVRFINWYMSKLHKVAHTDELATLTFVSVAQLVAPPTAVLAPRIALRVLGKTLWSNIALRSHSKMNGDAMKAGRYGVGQNGYVIREKYAEHNASGASGT